MDEVNSLLSTTENAFGAFTSGVRGFRDAFETGSNRSAPAAKPMDTKTIALYAGAAALGVVALIFIAKKVL